MICHFINNIPGICHQSVYDILLSNWKKWCGHLFLVSLVYVGFWNNLINNSSLLYIYSFSTRDTYIFWQNKDGLLSNWLCWIVDLSISLLLLSSFLSFMCIIRTNNLIKADLKFESLLTCAEFVAHILDKTIARYHIHLIFRWIYIYISEWSKRWILRSLSSFVDLLSGKLSCQLEICVCFWFPLCCCSFSVLLRVVEKLEMRSYSAFLILKIFHIGMLILVD